MEVARDPGGRPLADPDDPDLLRPDHQVHGQVGMLDLQREHHAHEARGPTAEDHDIVDSQWPTLYAFEPFTIGISATAGADAERPPEPPPSSRRGVRSASRPPLEKGGQGGFPGVTVAIDASPLG